MTDSKTVQEFLQASGESLLTLARNKMPSLSRLCLASDTTREELDRLAAAGALAVIPIQQQEDLLHIQDHVRSRGITNAFLLQNQGSLKVTNLFSGEAAPPECLVVIDYENAATPAAAPAAEFIFPDDDAHGARVLQVPACNGIYRWIDGHELGYTGYLAGSEENTAPPAPAPALLLFHGGGWEVGSRAQFIPFAQRLAALGLSTFTFDYRIKSKHGTTPFESVADAKFAARWMRENAAAFNINPEAILVGGGSAGGHIAAGITLFDSAPGEEWVNGIPKAFILLNPVTDTSEAGFGHDRIPGDPAALDLTKKVSGDLPPCLVMHGAEDQLVPIENSLVFDERMRAAGNVSRLIVYPGMPHAFFNYGFNGTNRYFYDTLLRIVEFLVSYGFLPAKSRPLLRLMNKQDELENLAGTVRGELSISRQLSEINEGVDEIVQMLEAQTKRKYLPDTKATEKILINIRALLPKLNRLNALQEFVKK